jgi:glyoxylase-like metal-dependent hydrolase (beta-lactamase superfamily II)
MGGIGFRRWLLGGAAGVLLAAVLGSTALAGSPEGMRLYVFTSHYLGPFPKAALQTGAGSEPITIPVAFFVIKHPKGNVMFDTGVNDKIIKDPNYWGVLFNVYHPDQKPDLAIKAQLQKIGMTTSDINYVVLGHMHLDHAGNVGLFPKATVVFQTDEIRAAFWPPPGAASSYIASDFAMLRAPIGASLPNAQKVIQLNGDLDLFGDGSVYVHRAVGHTPGSEMLVVRLPHTGTVVLTSDACYLKENLDKDILPSIGLVYSPSDMLEGYAWIKRVRDSEKGDVIFAHDPDTFKAHKHAPEYYD